MQIKEQIIILRGIIKNFQNQFDISTNRNEMVELSKKLAVLKIYYEKLMHSIGLLTEDEKSHTQELTI